MTPPKADLVVMGSYHILLPRVYDTRCSAENQGTAPISREREAVRVLMDSGKVHWSGGKPKGTAGTRGKGKPLADTVLEERR